MNKYLKFSAMFVIAVLFSTLFPLQFTSASTTPEPVVLQVDQSGTNMAMPLVLGLSFPNTEVLVYLNGEFAGLAAVNHEETGTDNFYYQFDTALPAGVHQISAVARDLDSLILSAMTEPIEIEILPLAAPTLVEPNEDTITGKVKPFITGLTQSGTKVIIFIDGVLNGTIDNLNHESGTANFAYKPFLNLSVGEHQAYAIAEDMNGVRSARSNVLSFNISQPTSAPTIFEPVINSRTTFAKPFIVGNAHNNSRVRVFIDHTLYGEFDVENDDSGTANFAYEPFVALAPGGHFVYTTALDSLGKESQWSNIIYFSVVRPGEPSISDTAATDAEEPIVKGDDAVYNERLQELISLARTYEQDNSVSLSLREKAELDTLLEAADVLDITAEELQLLRNMAEAEDGVSIIPDSEEPDSEEMKELKEILEAAKEDKDSDTGLINESKKGQSKLNLNLFIFILFLIAVIAWIFWVNRELIKEKKEENKDKKDDQDQFKL